MQSTSFSTYAALYSSPQGDVFQGQYATVMAEFRATALANGTVPAPATIYQKVANTSTSHHAYAVCYGDTAGTARVHVLHRPTAYDFQIGIATPEDNQVFAFLGDTRAQQMPPIVPFTANNTFHQTTQQARTLAGREAKEYLDNHPDEPLLPALADNEGIVVKTRLAMWLPPPVAAALLGGNLTPRDAFLRTWVILEAGQQLEACAPLVDWLLATCTLRGTDLVTRQVMPTIYMASDRLSTQRRTAFLNELPGLVAQSSTTAPGTSGATATDAALLRLADVVTLNEEQRTTGRGKTPASYFKTLKDTLYKITLTLEDSQLMPVWTDLANAGTLQRSTLAQHTREQAKQFGWDEPLITTTITERVRTLSFGTSRDADDLLVGLSPFLFLPRSQSDQQTFDNLARILDRAQEAGTLTVQDQLTAEAKHTLVPIHSWHQLELTFQRYYVFIYTLFGIEHPLVQALTALHARLKTMAPMLTTLCDLSRSAAYGILRAWQVRIIHWCDQQSGSTSPVVVPSLTKVLDSIAFREYEFTWAPKLPVSTYTMLQTKPPVPMALAHQSGIPTGPAPSAMALSPTTPKSHAASTPTMAPSPRDRTPVPNTSYHPDYHQYKTFSRKLADVIAAAAATGQPLPQNDSGHEFCLSFHTRGQCWSNCRRATDHRAQTAPERDRLLRWVRQHFT